MHSSNLKLYIVILLLVLILGSLIFLNVNNSFFANTIRNINTPIQNSVAGDFSIFDLVSASLSGKITKVSDKTIFFENLKGVKGQAIVADGIAISDLSKKGQATPSADLKRVELNKTGNMMFEIRDGKYFIVSITYPQP